MPSCTEWFNKAWLMMLMHKLTTIVKIKEGVGKAKLDFQNTWTLFSNFLGPD